MGKRNVCFCCAILWFQFNVNARMRSSTLFSSGIEIACCLGIFCIVCKALVCNPHRLRAGVINQMNCRCGDAVVAAAAAFTIATRFEGN